MSKFAVHGGDFFEAIGVRLDHLERRSEVVNADVLDAWYPPSPKVIAAIREHLDWLVSASPPTHAEGLREIVAESRGVDASSVLLSPGSSPLIFQLIPKLFTRKRVGLLDPTYGEYRHVLERCQARVEALPLAGPEFRPSIEVLASFARGLEGLVLVNPNSPTGVALALREVEALLHDLPKDFPVWIDETYIDFLGEGESAERLVMAHPNLLILKSMSKFYALSGLRVGYAVARPELVDAEEEEIAPWSLGIIAQLGAAEALRDSAYYQDKVRETHQLRQEFEAGLAGAGLIVTPSSSNFVLARLPGKGVAKLCEFAKSKGIFLRNCDSLSERFDDDYVRVAVKPREVQGKILSTTAQFLESNPGV